MKKDTQQNNNARTETASRLKATVGQMLRWTEMDFSKFQYEQGIAYLKAYTSPPIPLSGREGEEINEWAVSALERSRLYWNWWKNHWVNRDEAFIEFTNNTAHDLETRRDIYSDMHDGKTLAASIYPNGIILNESYALMITELVDKETQRV